MPHHLVGATEIARMLGLTRQRVNQLAREPGFPKPEVVLGLGAVWETDAIKAWAVDVGRPIVADPAETS